MRSKPKKRLGQNFLFDQNILRKIVSNFDLKREDVILEIGSGRGELTRLIAPLVASVVTVEIDPDLQSDLESRIKGYPNVRLLCRDILKLDLGKLFPGAYAKIRVVGNIPYYISSPIIEHLFRHHSLIDSAHLTVQKEFARRLLAAPGSRDYGSLSCFVQYYSEPKLVFNISKNCFFPRPKVDSSLVELRFRRAVDLSPSDERRFFRIVRSSFGKRRKTLRNSLSGVVGRARLETFFQRYSIDPNIRPEDLSINDFVNMALTKNN